jgi:hypothetical protein
MYMRGGKRNRPHEEAYDDLPGSPMGSAMSYIPDGSTSSSERIQQSRLVGNSSQNTLGTDNDGYKSGSWTEGSVNQPSFSGDQNTGEIYRDGRNNSYLNTDLVLRNQAVFQRDGPLPDPPSSNS